MSADAHCRVGVVGLGGWGVNLARNFSELGVLAALSDSDPAHLAASAQRYEGCSKYGDYAGLLNDPDIDAVAIATPSPEHADMVGRALEAGKDVFVEKPLALSAATGAHLASLAAARGRILMVGHLLWYHPAVLKLKQLIDSGELGAIRYIYSQRLNLGRIRREENILWSFAPHDVSLILGLTGALPTVVSAHGGSYLSENVEDVTVSFLEFANGLRAHIFVSWLHPFKEQKLVVVGERKMAVFDDLREEKLLLYPHVVEWRDNVPIANRAPAEVVKLENFEPLRAECEHFLDCVKIRAVPRTDAAEGVRVLEVLERCERALRGAAGSSYQPGCSVHPSAFLDEDVVVGEGTTIWHVTHLLRGSRVGRNCRIGQNVVIGPNVTVGDGVKIQNNVSVYEGVTLEDAVFVGPSVVFTNVINPRAEIPRMDELRPTRVCRGATLGANATILCGVAIGRYAMVGAGAVVTRDVAGHALVTGNPARPTGWVCACGVKLATRAEDWGCPDCDRRYREADGMLIEVAAGQSSGL